MIMYNGDLRADERESMVTSQLMARGVGDERVLRAFRELPRELFVPLALLDEAYADQPLPIGHGQTISQPYIVALMTSLLGLPEPPPDGGKLLEVGTGSGYQAAILAWMGWEVRTVERLPEVAALAKRNWSRCASSRVDRIQSRVGDGCHGWGEEGPFDGVLVTAAAPEVPGVLVGQLKVGARLVVPVGDRDLQRLLVVQALEDGVLKITESSGCRFVPLIGDGAF